MKRLPMILAMIVVMSLVVGAGSAWGAGSVDTDAAALAGVDETPAAVPTARLSKADAVALAKNIIPELNSQQLRVDYDENPHEGRAIWRISTERPSYVFGPYRSISISIDAGTGMLLSFSRQESSEATGSRVLTRQEAQNIAEAYLAKTVPAEIRAQLAADENVVDYQPKGTLSLGYSFHWNRVANEIPTAWDGCSLRVGAVTGDVIEYHLSWNPDITLPAPNALLSPEELTDRILNNVGLIPQYIVDTTPASVLPQVRLVYTLNSSVSFFNADTGEPQGQDGKSVPLTDTKQYDRVLTPRQDEAPASPALEAGITPEEGLSAATSFFRTMGYKGRVERSGSGSSGGPGYRIEMWGYTVLTEDAGQRTGAEPDVMIDTRDGRVVSFDNEQGRAGGQGELGVEQAKAKALAFLAKAAPELKENALIMQNINSAPMNGRYVFNLTPLVNGIPFSHHNIHISVDAAGGDILDYHRSLYPVTQIPPVAGMMSASQAAEVFKKGIRPELMYTEIQEDGRPTGKMTLVYHFAALGRGIDAHTGEIIGAPQKPNGRQASYTERIGDHWARSSLLLLAENGFLPDPEKFNPDAAIARRDGARLLTAAATRYWDYTEAPLTSPFTDVKAGDPDLTYFDRAVQMGLFTRGGTFNPNGVITREQFAAWLINALGYEEVAGIRGHIETPFKDAAQTTPALANHVALAGQLGLMGGDTQGNFRPRAGLTWGEAAAVTTMAAPRLQNSPLALYR